MEQNDELANPLLDEDNEDLQEEFKEEILEPS